MGLPIFAVVMFLVYYIAMVTVGSSATDWANDGLFGDGWHLFGIGLILQRTEAADDFTSASDIVNGYIDAASKQGIDTDAVAEALDTESEDFDPGVAKAELAAFVEDVKNIDEIEYTVVDEETMADEEDTAAGNDDLLDLVAGVYISTNAEPDPAGIMVAAMYPKIC